MGVPGQQRRAVRQRGHLVLVRLENLEAGGQTPKEWVVLPFGGELHLDRSEFAAARTLLDGRTERLGEELVTEADAEHGNLSLARLQEVLAGGCHPKRGCGRREGRSGGDHGRVTRGIGQGLPLV